MTGDSTAPPRKPDNLMILAIARVIAGFINAMSGVVGIVVLTFFGLLLAIPLVVFLGANGMFLVALVALVLLFIALVLVYIGVVGILEIRNGIYLFQDPPPVWAMRQVRFIAILEMTLFILGFMGGIQSFLPAAVGVWAFVTAEDGKFKAYLAHREAEEAQASP